MPNPVWHLDLYLHSVWTDVIADVISSGPVRWSRGLSAGALPTDRVARPGTMEFALNNSARNSAGLVGYYSPGHSNCRSGFGRGIPARLRANATVIWYGRLRTIDPTPGIHGPRLTHCLAQDLFADLSDTTVREISPQIGQTEVALIQAIIDALPAESQPTGTDFDAALDTYTYALYNIGQGASPIGLLNDVAISALGWIYGLGDGTLKYENRHARITASSAFTLTDTDEDAIDVPSTLGGVYNRIRATIHQITPLSTVLFASPGSIEVGAGQTFTVWGTYSDPDNPQRLIGASAFTTPLVATTDYVANSAADGSGADRTSSVSIAVTPFATTAKFDITNTFGDTVFVTTLQLRGTGDFDNAPQVFESFTPMDYGDRPLDIDLKFQDDANVAQDLADYLNATLSDPMQVQSVSVPVTRSAALLTQALARDIGDVITVTEDVTGVTAVIAAISGIEGSITNRGQVFRLRWNLAAQSTTGALILDDAVFGVLDAPEAVLGYA